MRRFTLHELLDRARQAALARAEAIAFLRPLLADEHRFLADGADPAALFARLPQVLPPSPPSPSDETLRSSAEAALEGRFDLLGLEGLGFGNPIDWHFEPTSDKRIARLAWKQLDGLDTRLTGNKKVIWELNRHQHLPRLARAFRSTGDERYANAVVEHITSWIRSNPPGLGINWVSSLELAFRSISWLWALSLLQDWKGWPSRSKAEIARSLHLQGRHVERYLSTYSSPNTHLTGEALGLYYLGTCLPELRHAGRWRELGRSILLKQLEVHVRPDGVYFEQATWYHRYTADFYMHLLLLAQRAGEPLPARASERLAALLDHLMWITRPDGTSPYVGDDDGGKLVMLEGRAPADWRALLSSGAVLFGRGDYKHVAGGFAAETQALLGADSRAKFEAIAAAPPAARSRAFRDGGYFVMRSGWDAAANFLLVDCGPHGVLNCGHAHADALAIEVAARGATMLVDPGTYTYSHTPELRDAFRSTAMHNTLTIDGLPSSEPAGPFQWKHVARCTLRGWQDHPRVTCFEGSHDGYRHLPATHSRALLFVNREYWVMLDRVDAAGAHEYAIHFHLAAGVEAHVNRERAWLEARSPSVSLDIVFPRERGAWRLAEGSVSPCFAARVPAPHANYGVSSRDGLALLSVLHPRATGEAPADIQALDVATGEGLSVTRPGSRDVVLWAAKAAVPEDVQSIDFEWAWVRRALDGAFEQAAFLRGGRVVLDAFEIVTQRPVELLVAEARDGALSIDVIPPTSLRIRPPHGTQRIVVNGRVQEVGDGDVKDVPENAIPALAPDRD